MEKDWIGTSKGMFKTIGASNHCEHEREQHDFYATDPETLEPLLAKERFAHSIWEPACGLGHLSMRLRDHGFNVRESDIINRIGNETLDFLKYDGNRFIGDIITTPPYSKAKEFVEKALDVIPYGFKVAMFLKLTFLEGKARRAFFEKTPPSCVYVFSERQKCAMNGDFDKYKQSAVAYAWFVWVKGYKGNPNIEWI